MIIWVLIDIQTNTELYNIDIFFSFHQILAAMRKELANSGLSEEEILTKTMLLQKALAGDNSPAFVNKTIKSAMSAAQITPADLAKVRGFNCLSFQLFLFDKKSAVC